MAASSENICNLAISHLGSGAEIQDLINERSAEAQACRRFYDLDLDQVLRDFPWPFAAKIADLGLVAQQPNALWAFAYRYPSDCLAIDRIIANPLALTGQLGPIARRDDENSLVKLDFGQDAQGQLIFTDQPNATLKYTIRVTDPTKFPPDFIKAFSLLLASDIGPRISKGTALQLSERARQSYMTIMSEARAVAGNEVRPERQPEAETIRARN